MNKRFRALSARNRFRQAARWHVRLIEDPLLAGLAPFRRWVSDPRNAAALNEISDTWHAVESLRPSVMQGALAEKSAGTSLRGRTGWMIGGGMALAACIGGIVFVGHPASSQRYSTDLTTRREVALDDGTRVHLDAGSAIAVRYLSRARHVTLDRGQATFDVAHDTTRPFIVDAGGSAVRATGTMFNIDLVGSSVRVTLLRGGVTVRPMNAEIDAPLVALHPGQQLLAQSGMLVGVSVIDTASVTAWQQGRLTFYDRSIADVAAEMNRYTPRRWSIDPAVGKLKISGSFFASDVDALLGAIAATQPVAVKKSSDGAVLLTLKR